MGFYRFIIELKHLKVSFLLLIAINGISRNNAFSFRNNAFSSNVASLQPRLQNNNFHKQHASSNVVIKINTRQRQTARGMHGASVILSKFSSTGVGLANLLVASSVGLYSEVKFSSVAESGAGILVTLITASILSNTGIVPYSHPGYELAWTAFLPASLAFLLLASSGEDDQNQSFSYSNTVTDASEASLVRRIVKVGIAFVFASFGSALGCLCSFKLCRQRIPGSWSLPPPFCLPPHLAALTAGCICASYIGGSVNLFATARFAFSNMSNTFGDGSGRNVLSAIAASDLMTMAVYFAGLAWCNQSKAAISLFEPEHSKTSFVQAENPALPSEMNSNTDKAKYKPEKSSKALSAQYAITLTALGLIGHALVNISNSIERQVGIPGTATGAITLFASLLSYFLYSFKFGSIQLPSSGKKKLRDSSTILSSVCFHIFFASLGFSANIVETASQYGAPTLAFCTIGLSVHVIVTGLLSLLWNSFIGGKFRSMSISLPDALVASNAAIGGPATAATFAGSISSKKTSLEKRALILAGTLWGVVGYAFGTSIGVSFTKALLSKI